MITYRQQAAPLIAETIEANKDKSLIEIKEALDKAYPFSEKGRPPYKIWCNEVKVQLKRYLKTVPDKDEQIGLF